MSHAALVQRELTDDVLLLTISRPSLRNALSIDTVAALADALVGTTDYRAVVLTGAGTAFCAGGDLANLSATAQQGAAVVAEEIYGKFHRLVKLIRRLPQPVVAAVNGAALGAGLDLALCCDLRVASSEATFASSWISMGLVPGMNGARSLVHAVGSARAAQLVLTGEKISASTALDWGLVNDVVPPAAVLSRSLDLAHVLAARPATAMKNNKAALSRAMDPGLDDELALLGATQGTLLTHTEFRSAAAAFLSRTSKTP